MCKKLGRKKVMQDKGKFINMPEYEVFRDWLELRKHQEKEHHVCDKPSEACRVLCFESAAQLASHYLNVHGQQMEVKLEFIRFDDEEDEQERGRRGGRRDEEEKKEQNVQITKESYKDHFPTLAQTNKPQTVFTYPVQQHEPRQEQWPSLLPKKNKERP